MKLWSVTKKLTGGSGRCEVSLPALSAGGSKTILKHELFSIDAKQREEFEYMSGKIEAIARKLGLSIAYLRERTLVTVTL